MRTFRSVVIAWCSIACAALWLPVAHGSEVTLKIATVSPDGSMWMRQLRQAGEDIAGQTDGRVKFKFYPGGVMGDDKAVLRKIRSRQLHGAVMTAGGLNQVDPNFELYSLPMVFNDLEEVDYVRQTMDDQLLAGLRETGFVGMGIAEMGFAYAMSKNQVAGFDDIRSQKFWIPAGDPSSELAANTFDISPIPLSIADVLGGLQTGLINSVAVPPVGAIALQWHTQLKYVVDLPLLYVYGVLAVQARQFDKLEAADQELVLSVMREVVTTVNAQNRTDHQRAVEVLKSQGLTWVAPDAAEVTTLDGLAREASDTLVSRGVISAELFEDLQGHLAEYRGTLD